MSILERYEPGPELSRTDTSVLSAATRREGGGRVVLQTTYCDDMTRESLLADIAHAAAALTAAGLPGPPVEWEATPGGVLVVYEDAGEPVTRGLARALDRQLVAYIGADAATALGALAGAGLVHGHVDPRTLFRSGRRGALVGLEALRAVGRPAAAVDRREYAAPELARGAPSDIAQDVYALGCVLYALLVGGPPLAGVTPRVPSEDEGVGWNALLPRMVATDPGARPRPDEIVSELRRIGRGPLVAGVAPVAAAAARREPRPLPAPASRRGPLLVGGGAILLFALAGMGLVLTAGGPGPARSAAPTLAAAPSAAATAEETATPTGAPPVVRTATPATAAPTTPPTVAPTPVPLAVAVPVVGPQGTTFSFTFRALPQGSYAGTYVPPNGIESVIVARGAVGPDGAVTVRLATDDRAFPRGSYLYKLTAGPVTRSIAFAIQ